MKAAVNSIFQGQNKLLYRNLIKTNIFQTLWLLQHYITETYFSNFSCMFLNPNNFFQFELELF